MKFQKSGLFQNYIMEKSIHWYQIPYHSNQHQVPCKRWGHKTVFVSDEILLFGGFSDVTYLNDLWAYNIHTNKWRQVTTKGNRPEGKSNFTMHYDQVTNELLVFGGGGSNKRRFNNVSILNWSTKQWSEVVRNNNQQAVPWQRTYHSSQYQHPFMIMFGGEGVANVDLDDLWVFDIETRKWRQIKCSTIVSGEYSEGSNINYGEKIEGRKFHSTVMIGHQFYVISGCRGNYSCIPSIYSIDLSPLFNGIAERDQKQHNMIALHQIQQHQKTIFTWKRYQISQPSVELISKWGHSSESYHGKIYIFGGRNQDDHNDLIQFDPLTSNLVKLQPNTRVSKLPKSRRRHSSCMIGSSMVIFGGFNLQYFNDMQYVSLFECRDALNAQNYTKDQAYEIIQLEQQMFSHFLQEMDKDRPEYDIELYLQSRRLKQVIVVKSVSHSIRKKSAYFANSLSYNNSSNPECNVLSVPISSLSISVLSFHIFNAFLIKDLLIVPKNCKLKRLYELLVCADYFQVPSLFQLIGNNLILKAIDGTENIDDIFDIAVNWKMQKLLKVCAQKKVLNKTYFDSCSHTVFANSNAAKIKEKYIEEILMQIQFDEIQKGQKSRAKQKSLIKCHKQFQFEEKGLGLAKHNVGNRKKLSIVEKFVVSFSKLCSSGSQYQGARATKKQFIEEDDDQDQQSSSDEIKMI